MLDVMRSSKSAKEAWWERALQKQYGICGTLAPLAGEYDLNFAVHQDGVISHVLKVMRPGCDPSFIEMQCQALDHMAKRDPSLAVPRVVRTQSGGLFAACADEQGAERLIWLITILPGRLYSEISPHPLYLVRQVGTALATFDIALKGFDHPLLSRKLKWDMRQSGWIRDHIELIDGKERQALVEGIVSTFENELLGRLNALPVEPIHNDANDYNVLVDRRTDQFRVSGIIDLGDMVAAPLVAELAIAGAYMVLGQGRPIAALAELVAGYNEVRPLGDEEIALVYPLILTRLAVSVTNAALTKREKPNDPYVTVSERPAWAFLEASSRLAPEWVLSCLRIACGKSGHPDADRIMAWLNSRRGQFAPMFERSLAGARMIELGVDGAISPRNPNDLDLLALNRAIGDTLSDGAVGLGRYGEPRLIYTAPEFRKGTHLASDRRTVHIAVDVFIEQGTEIHAPLDGIVHAVEIRPDLLDYGAVAVLEHKTPDGVSFFTL